MQSLSLKLGVLAAVARRAVPPAPPARDLTVVSWGGAYQDAQREVYFKPFMATGIKMAEESWDGGVGTLRAKIQGGNNNWDVVQVESDELLLGCEEGLYEKLDWAKLGGKDKYLPDAVNDCGVGAIVYSFVLAYDGDKIKGDAPKNWADFWNTAEVAGQARAAQGPEDDAGDRADGRRRRAAGRLQDARHRRRRRARVQEARPAQGQHGLVGKGRAAAAAPRFGRSGDDRRLQRPHRRRERQGQEELQDRLDQQPLHDRLVGDHEGHAEQGRRREVPRLRQRPAEPEEPAAEDPLRRDGQGRDGADRQERAAEPRHRAAEHRRRRSTSTTSSGWRTSTS